jgi:uncharacterized protein (DUF4415 family)
MAIIKSTVEVGQKPTKEQLKQISAIAQKPVHYTADCPESTPEALREFAMLAAERNRRNRKQAVTIRLVPDCLVKYKALGDGYTTIMADVLSYVADNPEILSKALS